MKTKKILIISALYYDKISKKMENIAINHLKSKKIRFKLINVPGAFEIPVMIAKNKNKYDGFIALGCVIKGQTPHFDFISAAVTNSIMNISVNIAKPVGNGIITCLNKKQATNRCFKSLDATKAVISVLKH